MKPIKIILTATLLLLMVSCSKEDSKKCPCTEKSSGRIIDDPNGVVDYSKEYGYSILHGFDPDVKGNYYHRFIPCPEPPKSEQLPNGTEVVLFGNTYDCSPRTPEPQIVHLRNYELQSKKDYETPYFKSVGEVVDVFEMAYGDTRQLTLGSKKLQLKLTDIVDYTIDCYRYDMPSWAAGLIRIIVFFQVEGQDTSLRVPSISCAPLEYKTNNDNIKDIKEQINDIKDKYKNFNSKIIWYFGNGKILEYPYKLFIARAYPIKAIYYQKKEPFLHAPPTKEDYKFVFILTKIE